MNDLIEKRHLAATIIDISWERIFLTINVRLTFNSEDYKGKKIEGYLVNSNCEAKSVFVLNPLHDDIYTFTLNVTNTGENKCIPAETYMLAVCSGDDILAIADTDPSIVGMMEDRSRNFLYKGKKNVYTVTFYVEEGFDDLPFRMYILNSSATGSGLSFPTSGKKGAPFKAFKSSMRNRYGLRSWVRRVYRLYYRKYHGKSSKKTVLFMTEQSNSLPSNLSAVAKRMAERKMTDEFQLLFSARAASAEDQSKKSWFELLKKMAKSDVILLDDHAPLLDWLKVKDTTKIVQLWHAGAGFKSSGYSRWGHIGCPAPQSCHRQYDYGISGSKNISPFFSEVWGINDELVLPTGMPRMDEYLDEKHKQEKTEELYAEFPQCKGKKVILFGPTYRGKNKATAYYPYELIDFERLYQLCGDEYIVFFKMHPWVNEPIPIEEKYRDKFFDLQKYPNINDLFYITDLLITDYSSNIFEYSLRKKPMLFFAFDKIQYSFSRGFHRNYEESAPGKICYTFEEVLKAIEEKDFELEKVEEYVKHHFDFIDSSASDRVIDWIICGKLPKQIEKEISQKKKTLEHMHELDFSVLEPYVCENT